MLSRAAICPLRQVKCSRTDRQIPKHLFSRVDATVANRGFEPPVARRGQVEQRAEEGGRVPSGSGNRARKKAEAVTKNRPTWVGVFEREKDNRGLVPTERGRRERGRQSLEMRHKRACFSENMARTVRGDARPLSTSLDRNFKMRDLTSVVMAIPVVVVLPLAALISRSALTARLKADGPTPCDPPPPHRGCAKMETNAPPSPK